MARRIPPLYPLRAFEAAARLGTISAAARELSLSQSAISHEVKALETFFGTSLFRRTRAGLQLTARGMQVFAVAESAFADLSRLATINCAKDLKGTVSIAAPPLFGANWLLPKLDQFASAYPDINFRILNVTEDRPELVREVDIAVIGGSQIPRGHEGMRLVSVMLTPVASPTLMARFNASEPIAFLRQNRILHEGSVAAWQLWCSSAKIHVLESKNDWVLDDPALVIDACIRGHGIALGTTPLIDNLLADGRLIAFYHQAFAAPKHYFLTRPDPPTAERAAGVVFDWLKGYASGSLPPCSRMEKLTFEPGPSGTT